MIWYNKSDFLFILQKYNKKLRNILFFTILLKFLKLNLIFILFLYTGSPFMYTVGSTTSGGFHKIQAGGPGLEKGEVNAESKL